MCHLEFYERIKTPFTVSKYYHLRSTVKCERFFAQVYFSNETVSHATVSTGPMKMFRLEHETMNVYQRNVAHFWSRGCRFHKINDIFQGFGDWCHCDFRKMEALKVNKFGRTYRTGTQDGSSSLCRIFVRAYGLWKRDIVTAVIYCYITTKVHYAKRGGVMYEEKR